MIEVMAVAPHPDDVEFGCGGILFKLNKDSTISLCYVILVLI